MRFLPGSCFLPRQASRSRRLFIVRSTASIWRTRRSRPAFAQPCRSCRPILDSGPIGFLAPRVTTPTG
jgi:hypothetical protein